MTDIVPIPELRPSSEFPTNADRNAGVFNSKAFNWANTSRDMASDMNAIASAARTNAIATHEIAIDAKNVTAANKTAAQNAQSAAELAASNAAGSAAFYGRWSELTGALNMPANVTHDDKDWRLLRNLIDVTAAEPGISDAWEEVNVGLLIRQTRTANVALDASAHGQLIDIVSGTFTQTFAATATLGDGWWCYLKNSGSGDITLDPNGAELIDGLTSYIMYPGEARLVQCDGATLRTVVLNSFYKVFTASGNFIKPPGYSAFRGYGWSGGGSGGKDSTGAAGGGGGGCGEFIFPNAQIASTASVVVGAGGLGVTTNGSGNPGGNTEFSTFRVYGQSSAFLANSGGSVSNSFAPQNNPANGFEGAISSMYEGSNNSVFGGSAANVAIASGTSIYGGAAGGSVSSSGTLLSAGTSVFGGNGGVASNNGVGQPGAAPGGGGGATRTGASSGAGARGELRIWGVI